MNPFCFLLVFIAAFLQLLPFKVLSNSYPLVPGIFSFGDSLSDVGTNLYVPNSTILSNFPPYGETFFHYPTGRFSNGRLYVDFLAQLLRLPLTHPFLQPNVSFEHGANFASAGSGFLNSTNAASHVVPFSTQISQFQDLSARLPLLLGHARAQNLISKAIYTLNVGSNDIATYVESSTTPTGFITLLLEEAEKGLLALYKAGGRKFVLSELGPVGCIPSIRLLELNTSGGACYEPINQLVLALNVGLKGLAANLTASLTEATFFYAESYDFIMGIIEDGGKIYGYTNTTFACCGAGPFNTAVSCGRPIPDNLPYEKFLCKDPSTYLFWDGNHPTEKTYRLVFQRNLAGLEAALL